MSTSRLKPFYVSLGIKHNLKVRPNENEIYRYQDSADTTIEATVREEFRHPLVEKASDYLVAIERMEISTNAIPFYDASPIMTGAPPAVGHEIIRIHVRNDPNADPFELELTENAYSLTELFKLLNDETYEDPSDNFSEIKLTFSIENNGYIILTLLEKTFTNFYFEFPRRLNQILGISSDVQEPGSNIAVSAYPRVDLGDDLDHFLIVSNLPTHADSIGNAKYQVLTDLAPTSAYSNTLSYDNEGALRQSGFSTSMRQKAIYTPPGERRYCEMIGDFPINSIVIQVYYVNQDNDIKPVPLCYGGAFEIKLGFYLKS